VTNLGYVAGLAALVAGISLSRTNRRRSRVPVGCWLLVTGLLAITPGLWLLAPPTLRAVQAWEPIPYLTRLTGDAFVLAAWYCITMTLVFCVKDDRTTRRQAIIFGGLLGGALVLMITSVWLQRGGKPADEFSVLAGQPGMLVYQAAFLTFMSTSTVTVIVLAGRYLGRSQAAWAKTMARRGMALVRGAGACGLLACAWDLVELLPIVQERNLISSPGTLHEALVGSSVLLLVAGMTMPTWGAYVRWRVRMWRAGRLAAQLEPLWRVLVTDVVPEVRLPEPQLDVDLLLYRRVIEIRDAEWMLRPFVPPGLDEFAEARTWVLGVRDRDRSAVVAATALMVAVVEYRKGTLNPSAAAAGRFRLTHGAVDIIADARCLVPLAKGIENPAAWRISLQFCQRFAQPRPLSAAG
jgi:hypothetical protein